MQKLLEKIENFFVYLIVFLLPLAAFPISVNPYVVSKVALLAFGLSMVFLLKVIRIIYEGKLELKFGKFDFPVFLLVVSYAVSTVFITPNKMEAVLLPGTTSVIVSAALLYFVINQLSVEAKTKTKKLFYLSAVVFSIISILSTFGSLAKISFLPAYTRVTGFNTEGGFLPSFIFLVSMVPYAASYLIKEKDIRSRIFLGVTSFILLAGVSVNLYRLLPGQQFSPKLPDYRTSWYITVDTLKASPLLGAGPGNYLTAFNRFRPIGYNATDNWSVRFSTAKSFYLTSFTEIGMLGAAGLILLGFVVYKQLKEVLASKDITKLKESFLENTGLYSFLLVALILLFSPASTLVVVSFFVLLSFASKTRKSSLGLQTQVKTKKETKLASGLTSRIPALLVTLPIIAAVISVTFLGMRIMKAEYTYRRALAELAAGNGLASYDTMREAINTNPTVDRYHASYSQINLILANAISSKATGNTPQELTDQDRTNIAQLVQQAIREGKSTVALNPLRASNWEVLARTYQAIIPLAKGADVYAVQTLAQAVALDPMNPNLRISLGGLHYALGNTDTAVRVFELAVSVKPDLANSHYNLAFAYDKAGNLEGAIEQMTLVLSLVEPDSNDYKAAKDALEALENKRELAETESQSDNLTPPEESAEPAIEPQIELPEDSEPPESPITPTPTPVDSEVAPAVSPSVTPTITP